MDFVVEQYISNFIKNQFPSFYQEEGPVFIEFVKAYYEWMESNGNAVGESRKLLDYRDIDSTITEFLEFFQKKYLYGIPFNIIINKRYLLKHILDVYRSKGTIQCYKLLFRLIYNEDVEVYLPGQDMLRVSDGKWHQPKYLEVSYTGNLKDLVGETVEGVSSGTTAVIENYVQETHNKNILNILYLSNIKPYGASFSIGEKIVKFGQTANNIAIDAAPTLLGSLDTIEIINGGQDFKIGDILKIAHKDPITQETVSYGVDGLLRVAETQKTFGQIYFDLVSGGFGYMANAEVFIYNNPADEPTVNASFDIFAVSNARRIEYNTDLICDYANLTIDSVGYGFPLYPSANLSTNIGMCFTYTNNVFGSIASLTNIQTGNNYIYSPNVFVRSVQLSNVLSGNISYTTNHYHVAAITKTSTTDSGYTNGDIITVSNVRPNVNITESRDTDPAERHLLTLVSNNFTVNVYANSTGYSNTSDTLKFPNANSYFAANDLVLYQVSESTYTPISGLTNYTYYYINFANSSSITLSTRELGSNATATITTNNTGGISLLNLTEKGYIFISDTANVVVSNSSGGNTTGNGAAFSVEFRPYITGIGTNFDYYFSNNDVIWIKANNSLTSTEELQVIRYVGNSTSISLYGFPNINSTASAKFKAAPTILPSNFAPYEEIMYTPDGSVVGENEIISSQPSLGNGTISAVKGLNSGKAYLEGEIIKAYIYGAINTPTVKTPGTGYTNGELLTFIGGGTVSFANGFITTDSNGSITSATLTYAGSGYESAPSIRIKTANGSGGVLTTTVTEFNTLSQVSGRVLKTGIGKGVGYWENNDGFLNNDKKIQGPEFPGFVDGPAPTKYYYQDYSYELKVALTLEKYKDVLYNTFHSAGSELFGKFLLRNIVDYPFEILEELNTFPNTLTCDSVDYSCDNSDVNVGME